jgi:hypothetical protein
VYVVVLVLDEVHLKSLVVESITHAGAAASLWVRKRSASGKYETREDITEEKHEEKRV